MGAQAATRIFIAASQASATAAGMVGTDTSVDGSGPATFTASGAVADSLLLVSTLEAALASGDVTVSTANAAGTAVSPPPITITVVDPVSWSSGNSLALVAAGGIAINAAMSGPFGSVLTLDGGSGTVTQSAGAGIDVSNVEVTTTAAGNGAVTLTSPANAANMLAAVLPNGGIQFVNDPDIEICTMPPPGTMSGITAPNGAATVTSLAGFVLVTGPVSAKGVTLNAPTDDVVIGDVVDARDGALGLQAGGDIFLAGFAGIFDIVLSGASAVLTTGPGGRLIQAGGNNTITVGFASPDLEIGMDRLTVNANLSMANLIMDGGDLAGSGNLSVSGTFDWSIGDLSGAGTLDLASAAVGTISDAVTLSRTINTSGMLQIVNTGAVATSGNGTVLNVLPGGTLDLQVSGAFAGDDVTPEMINIGPGGTIRKTAGPPSAFTNVLVTNAGGTLSVAAGETLQMGLGAFPTNAGVVSIGSGATLTAGALTNASSGSIQGVGLLNLGGALLTNNGTINPGGTATVGTLTMAAALDTSNGTLVADLLNASTYDVLTVFGPITVSPATVLNPTPMPLAAYASGTTFDIVQDAAALVPTGTLTSPPGFTAAIVASPPVIRLTSLLTQPAVAPTIGTITPATGPASGGQSVTITGTEMIVATVTIGGTAATVTGRTPTSVTFTTPAHAAGPVDVIVTNSGQSTTVTSGYTYVAAPTIGSISPNAGPLAGGQSVTLTGTALSGASVTIGGIAATVTSTTSTTATFTTPPHAAGAVDVSVSTIGGSATATNGYAYAAAPAISSVSPNSGPTGGGQSVTIAGTGFAGASSVAFGGSAAAITANTGTSLTVTTSAHAAGIVDVVVTAPGGSVTSTGAYTYVTGPAPTSVAPNSGPVGGGQGATISGTSLSGATSVTFGGVAATIGGNTATSITVTTPAHAAGLVDVVVTTSGGTATLSNAYTYAGVPTIASVSPNTGPAAGGQSVTITGTNLANATSVTFGGVAAAIGASSATSIAVTTPPHAAGAVDVVVTTAGGSVTSTNGYTYGAAPSISGIAPNSGPTAGGQSVVISGSNLASASSVTFGGVAATLGANSATSITVTTPPHAAGAADVVITTANGTATSAGGYAYTSAIRHFQGPSATGTGTIVVDFTTGDAACSFTTTRLIPLTGDPASPPAGSAPADVTFPQGLFTFTIGSCAPGAAVDLTIVYPQPLPAGTRYWKYGPAPGNATPHWYVLPATVSGNTASFRIVDGGLGDDDLAANGTIVDQGGPGAGGLAVQQIPTLGEWALVLLALILGVTGSRSVGARRAR